MISKKKNHRITRKIEKQQEQGQENVPLKKQEKDEDEEDEKDNEKDDKEEENGKEQEERFLGRRTITNYLPRPPPPPFSDFCESKFSDKWRCGSD